MTREKLSPQRRARRLVTLVKARRFRVPRGWYGHLADLAWEALEQSIADELQRQRDADHSRWRAGKEPTT